MSHVMLRIENALDELACRVRALDGTDFSKRKIADEIQLAAVYIGDGAIETGCKILADGR